MKQAKKLTSRMKKTLTRQGIIPMEECNDWGYSKNTSNEIILCNKKTGESKIINKDNFDLDYV